MDIIFKQYDARRDRFEEGALTSEARYLETIAIWDAILSFENPAKSLFGLEAFHSMGGYGAGRFRGRQAHVDYNLILVTNGLVGLFLYLNISHRSISFDTTNYAAFSVNKKALCTFITWTQGRPWVSPLANMKGLLCAFFDPDFNGTKFLTLAMARVNNPALSPSRKLSTCLNFRFTIFKKLSTIDVVFFMPCLTLCDA